VIAKVLAGVILALILALALAGWQLDRARKALVTAETSLATAESANKEYALAIERLNEAHAEEIRERDNRITASKRAIAAIEQRKPRPVIRVIQSTKATAGTECETSKHLLDTFLRDADK
jgi:uncharacterized protein HemX